MNRNSLSYDFLWLGITLFPLLIVILLLPLQPHDYWWYLRLGRDILEAGAVPIVDTYSSLQAGQSIVYQSWLSAIFLWVIFKTGGISLTIFFSALCIGLTYAMLWVLMRRGGAGPRLASFLILLAGLSGSNNWGVRPQLFVYPLFLAVVWILLKWQDHDSKFLWALVIISFTWTNLHGSFILFFILVALAVIFGKGERKKLFFVALVALAVTLANPRGFILWQSVIETFTKPGIRDLSPEWLPPLNQGWQMNIFFAWMILLVPLASFARRRLSTFELILFLSFSWLALTGIRYVIWDLFVISMLTAFLIPESMRKLFDAPQNIKIPSLNFGLGATFLLMPFLLLPGIRENWWSQSPTALDIQTPVAAADWLMAHPELPDPMWNDVVFGSYLIHAIPVRPVWIDTRIQVIFTSEQAEQYLFVQSAQPGWEIFLEKNKVNLLVLAHTQPALVNAAQNSDMWCRQYYDDIAVIFSRCEAK